MWSLGTIFNYVWKAFFLWSFVSPVLLPILLPTKGSSDDDAGSHLAPPPPSKQHFEFHPVGYGRAGPKHNHSAATTNGKDDQFKAFGYYKKDSQALFRSIQDVVIAKSTTIGDKNATEEEQQEDDNQEEFNDSLKDSDADVAIVLNLDLDSDPQAQINFLRHVVTFLIGISEELPLLKFEAIVVLDSHGGSVSAYGLLSDQLRRLREIVGHNGADIVLTVSCDQAALSGGYMMAALASPGQLLAAPFAYIGSIGARTSTVFNVRGLLEPYGVTMASFKGGKYKDPTNPFNEMSEDEKEHMQRHIDSFHEEFRVHVRKWRGDVIQDYETATSGAYWTGKQAKELGLVDEILTSDEYIARKIRSGCRVLTLVPKAKKEKARKSLIGTVMDFVFSNESTNDAEWDSGNAVSFGGYESMIVASVAALSEKYAEEILAMASTILSKQRGDEILFEQVDTL